MNTYRLLLEQLVNTYQDHFEKLSQLCIEICDKEEDKEKKKKHSRRLNAIVRSMLYEVKVLEGIALEEDTDC